MTKEGERLVWELNCTGCHRLHFDEVVYETVVKDRNGKERPGHVRLEGLVTVDEEEELTFQCWKGEPRVEARVGDPVAIPKNKIRRLLLREGAGALREAEIGASLKKYLVQIGEAESEAFAATYTPPVLAGEGRKVQSPWLFQFLRAPVVLRPWLKTRMPTFPLGEADAERLTRYFPNRDGEPYPFQFLPEKEEASLAAKERKLPGRLDHAAAIFNSKTVNCGQCHVRGKEKPPGDPSGWAPDLSLAQARLRPGWIRRWLDDPQKVEPGTKMPTFFPEGDLRYQEFFAAPREAQIDGLVDFLMNFPAAR
jgi:hypothetical protein